MFLLFAVLLLGGFEYLMCVIVSTVNVSGALEEIMKSLPPTMRSIASEAFFGGLTVRGILAFGWNHPTAHALGTALAIVLASRAVAGEVESGTIELVLSQPISRMGYVSTQILFALGSLALLSTAGITGTILGEKILGLDAFGTASLLQLAFNFFLLQSAWFAITLMLSVFAREGGWVTTVSFLLALVSYLIRAIGSLWQDAAFLLPYSLHDYYSPQEILLEGILEWKSVLVLSSVFVFGIGMAALRFQRRDLA